MTIFRYCHAEFLRSTSPLLSKTMTQDKENIAHDFNHGVKSPNKKPYAVLTVWTQKMDGSIPLRSIHSIQRFQPFRYGIRRTIVPTWIFLICWLKSCSVDVKCVINSLSRSSILYLFLPPNYKKFMVLWQFLWYRVMNDKNCMLPQSHRDDIVVENEILICHKVP